MPTALVAHPLAAAPDILDATTRREIVIGAGAALLLGACGAGEHTDTVSSTTIDGAGPVTNIVAHKYGSTEVPADPQRVVTVGLVDHDAVLALGTVPMGITATELSSDQRFGVWPWAHDRLGEERPEVLPSTEVNIERIATLQPDLILAVYSGITEQEYQTLSQIAPTVAQSEAHPNYQTPWDTMTRTIGEALGRQGAAEELIAEVEGDFADARRRHPEFAGKTAIYAGVLDAGGYYAEVEGSSRVGIVTSLGFTIPEDIRSETFYAEIGQEQLELLDRDVLLWELADPASRSSIEADLLYQQLDVAKEGRAVFVVDSKVAAGLAFVSVLSLRYALDRLVPQLAAAVDGDPATTP